MLEQICASVLNKAVIDSLELQCASWAEPIRLVQGFKDKVLGDGAGAFNTFTAVPMGLILPSRSGQQAQKITFALDNVTGQAQRAIDLALDSGQTIRLILRRYTEDNLLSPAERPFVATVKGGSIKGISVQIDAGFNNILDWKWPRLVYNLNDFPDLAYV